MEGPQKGEKRIVLEYFCQFPPAKEDQVADLHQKFEAFWEKNGSVFEVCKFQKNPMKNFVFDKEKRVDLLKDCLLFSQTLLSKEGGSRDLQVFCKAEKDIATSTQFLGRIVSYSASRALQTLYEGQISSLQPHGFGRLLYFSENQVKSVVAEFTEGKVHGKAIFFVENPLTKEIGIFNQGIYNSSETVDQGFKEDWSLLHEEPIKNFGGASVKHSTFSCKSKQPVQEVANQMNKLGLEDKPPVCDTDFEIDPNILLLFPDQFEKVAYDDSKDVFVMFYSSTCPDEFQVWQKLAEEFKGVDDLIIAGFNRGTFLIPGVSEKEAQMIEKKTKGKPNLVFFAQGAGKQGQQFNFDCELPMLQRFLGAKSQAVKAAKDAKSSQTPQQE